MRMSDFDWEEGEGGGGGGTRVCFLPRRGQYWAREHGGPSVTPPHRSTDTYPPGNAPWVGGHHCATGDIVWTVPTCRVSTDLTWGPRAERSHMDVGPMLFVCHRRAHLLGNCGAMNPRVWQPVP